MQFNRNIYETVFNNTKLKEVVLLYLVECVDTSVCKPSLGRVIKLL